MKASRHVDAPVLQTLEPYPEMKDSGVPALGNIPVHWQVLRVKNLCRMRSGDGITAESITPVGAYPVYGGNGQRGYTSEYTHDGTFVLIGRQGALCGNVHLARGRFWASEHAVVTTVRSGYLPEWIGAILTVIDLNQYSIAAAQPGLSVERVLDLRLPVPPVSEQAAIVRFLDHADRRIRRYIRAQQKLIALLEEQKQAIIHRAVTRGLDPHVRLKTSGVEWLGDVPEHWEVVRLRNTSEMRVSNVDKHAKDDEQPVRLCNYVDVYKNDRIRSGMAFMRATATTDEIERFRLQSGDVLITKDSEAWNDIGVPALVEDTQDDIVSGYHLALLRPFPERVDGGYLFRALQSPAGAYQFHVEANGVTRYGLSHSAIRSVWLPRPPLSEQAAIVSFLDRTTAAIDAAATSAQRETSLLREYRTRLIADVVTGKLDVREAAARLPDEVEELEPLDEADALIDGEEEPTDALVTVP